MKLNPKQQSIVDQTEGFLIVDAGAGTGKTATITQRYGALLEKASPSDILLLTFTDNAATNMKDRIVAFVGDEHDMSNCSISTFHSFCNVLLRDHGRFAGRYLGIDRILDENFMLVENDIVEQDLFHRFFSRFKERFAGRYDDFFSVVGDRSGLLLNLIHKLSSKGVFPKNDGWFLNGENVLLGDLEGYMDKASDLNAPREGKSGKMLKSELLNSFSYSYKYNCYIDAPSLDDDTIIEHSVLLEAFSDDRKALAEFVRVLYFEYLKHSISINKINFDFLLGLAFVLLYHDGALRKRVGFEYVMVDEFQDTNELQFLIILLLMKKSNLCVVGDWKQGIYGFRNATIENILEFERKVLGYIAMLNADEVRIGFGVETFNVEFDESYRSLQPILDFSNNSLVVQATQYEKLDEEYINSKVTRLESRRDALESQEEEGVEPLCVDFIESENEEESIISKINELVDEGNSYCDIAVLSRRRSFSVGLLEKMQSVGIPAHFDGGVELFRSKAAVVLLAWLRVLSFRNHKSGWLVLLELEGYGFSEIQDILESGKYPTELISFLDTLGRFRDECGVVAEIIFDRYGISNEFSFAIANNLASVQSYTHNNVSKVRRYIEDNIKAKQTYPVEFDVGESSVTVQTIHASKGLEYPIVIIADINQKHFPSQVPERDPIVFNDLVGLRAKKVFDEHNGYHYLFDNWKSNLVLTKLGNDYDEERRLLYVAITRAKDRLILSAGAKPSAFFSGMEVLHSGKKE